MPSSSGMPVVPVVPVVIDRPETFIGWRYLFRRHRSPAVAAATIALGLATLVLGAIFVFGKLPADGTASTLLAVATVAALLAFATALTLNFFSVFTTVSMTGVFWGVAALTVVLSVTSGFQEAFQDKVLGVNAHVLVMKYGLDFSEYRSVAAKIEAVPEVRKPVAAFVFNEMMVAHGGALSGVLVKGIRPEPSMQVLSVGGQLVSGDVASLARPGPPPPGQPPLPAILVGRELARKLKAKLGDTVRLISPLAGLDPSLWTAEGRAPRMREFRIGGIFYSGFDEYDRRLVYIHLPEAQAFLDAGDVVTGVEMRVDDLHRSKEVARGIERALGGPPYRVIDWRELNHNLFTALQLQKLALAVLLFLIILVAMFGVIATLTMLVIDKTREIAILKSLGLRSSAVAATFQVAGMTIGVVGTGVGIALGLGVCAILGRYGYRLDPRVYLIDHLPVTIHYGELGIIALSTLAVCFLATLIPALRAASLRPVEGLRYE